MCFTFVNKIFQNLETSTFKGLGVLKLANGIKHGKIIFIVS